QTHPNQSQQQPPARRSKERPLASMSQGSLRGGGVSSGDDGAEEMSPPGPTLKSVSAGSGLLPSLVDL
ncbi:hypothetical protein BGW38_010210, partial [Lunasporangiospora selenospora]